MTISLRLWAAGLAAITAFVALAGSSVGAADIPVKAPVPPPLAWALDPVPMFGDFLAATKFGAFKISENESPKPVDRV